MEHPDILYQALLNRDTTYEARYFVGVKSTGIFCRLTCRAKKPLRQNVTFFDSISSAMQHGYRPCKICQPTLALDAPPRWVSDLLIQIEKDPGKKWKDQDLRDLNLNPATVRRWFNNNYQMTFQAFARLRRINHALQHGGDLLDQSLAAGYESISGYTTAMRNNNQDKKPMSSNIIHTSHIQTPIGPMLAGVFSNKLCLLEFTDRPMLESNLKTLTSRMNANLLPGHAALFGELKQQLNAYFRGELTEFTVPLEFAGTPFQQKAWQALLEVPYGETRSYLQQAEVVGNKQAVRAVAVANGQNRIAILIPCHRIIGSDGSLTGYGGGLWRKKWLLELESKSDQMALPFDQPNSLIINQSE